MTQPYIIRNTHMRDEVLYLIANLSLEKEWEVTVKPYRKKRTLSQNSLMWKWVSEVAAKVSEWSGHDKDEVHEFFKAKFLTPRIVEIDGETREYRTTTKLTRAEMSEYMERIYAWATSELGLMLPIPQELGMSDRDRAA